MVASGQLALGKRFNSLGTLYKSSQSGLCPPLCAAKGTSLDHSTVVIFSPMVGNGTMIIFFENQ